MPVEVVEIGDDDRNRKCDGQDAGDDADGADHLADHANRRDVTVPDGRHRDDRPPERLRYRRQLRSRLAGVGVVDDRREDDGADEDEEKEHAQFVHAGAYRHAEHAQTLRVLRKF